MATTSSATGSTNVITTLSAGSGIDSKALATNLVEAEKAPRKGALDKQIKTSEAKISGYSGLMYAFSTLKDAFTGMQFQSNMNPVAAASTQPAVRATANANANVGANDIDVLQLARAQRNASLYYAKDATFNGGRAFSMTVALTGGGSKTVAIPASATTPAGVVNAINNAGAGVRAQLVDTGTGATPLRIVLTAADTGLAKGFSVTTNDGTGGSVANLDLSTVLQTPLDASLDVNGVRLTRPSNTIADAIPGVTLELNATTTTPAQVQITRDVKAARDKITSLVSAFNDVRTVLNVVSDPKSTVENLGGTLTSDSLIAQLRSVARTLVTGDSGTPGANVTALRDIGITLQRDGTLAVDDAKLDAALANNYDDVVKMMTGNTTPATVGTGSRGLAGDAVKRLTSLLGPSGPIMTQSTSAESQITRYKKDLERLDDQMSALLTRYTKQFAVMDELVGRINSQKSSLKNSFDGLMAMYTNK